MELAFAVAILAPTLMALLLAAGYLMTVIVMLIVGGIEGFITELRHIRPERLTWNYHAPVPHH